MNKGITSLTENDRKIIEHLFRVKVATIYQLLEDRVSSHKDRRNLVIRLGQLARSEYVAKLWHEKKRVFTIGKKGFEYLSAMGRVQTTWSLKYVQASPYQLEHDLLLTDIYSALERLPMSPRVQTHNQLLMQIEDPQSSYNVPDALISSASAEGGQNIAFELELSPKDQRRYEMTFDNYYGDINVSSVLYLVDHQSRLKNMLHKVDDLVRLGEKSRIFVGCLKDFRKKALTCPFEASDCGVFQFDHCMHQIMQQKCNEYAPCMKRDSGEITEL